MKVCDGEQRRKISHFSCSFLADINECTDFSMLCFPGECMNEPDGNFYFCKCEGGITNNGGDPSMMMETCIGINMRERENERERERERNYKGETAWQILPLTNYQVSY